MYIAWLINSHLTHYAHLRTQSTVLLWGRSLIQSRSAWSDWCWGQSGCSHPLRLCGPHPPRDSIALPQWFVGTDIWRIAHSPPPSVWCSQRDQCIYLASPSQYKSSLCLQSSPASWWWICVVSHEVVLLPWGLHGVQSVCVCVCVCMHVCMNNQWTTSPWIKKTILHVMQSHPLHGMCMFWPYTRLYQLCWGGGGHKEIGTVIWCTKCQNSSSSKFRRPGFNSWLNGSQLSFLQISSLLTKLTQFHLHNYYCNSGTLLYKHPWKPPEVWKSLYTVKRTGSPSPNSIWTVQIHSMQTLICCFHKIMCHFGRFQRPGIPLALSLIALASLNIAWQWRGPKMCLLHAQQPKNLLPQVYQNYGYVPIPDTQWCPNSIRFREVPQYINWRMNTHTINLSDT